MRSRGVRLDLFICMIITAAIFAGIWTVGDKSGVVDKIFDGIGMMVDGGKNVPDGEVGGYATDDTPRAYTMEEVAAFAQEGKTFTVVTDSVSYLNHGVYVGGDHDWRVLELDDDNAIAVKLNVDKIQDAEDSYDEILPVGRVILEAPAALDEIWEGIEGTDLRLISDAYIDMDGEANSTYVNPNMQAVMMVAGVVTLALPWVAFVLYILAVFAVHSVFVKLGIFPPVFKKTNVA